MTQDTCSANDVEIRLEKAWAAEEIANLYRAGGWWKDSYDLAGIAPLMAGSFLFVVAVDRRTGRAVGMGRLISDGVSDGYIQDLVVMPSYRRSGIGKRIVSALVAGAKEKGLGWIGLIAEPGSDRFYETLGFKTMPGHVPMLFSGGQ